ncbi:hypothetical protein NL108_016772 [Boleophthalmus pectinirostris]|nr:hypothetical protein NL108_016772 [Boleophthalmus pectinirostris]
MMKSLFWIQLCFSAPTKSQTVIGESIIRYHLFFFFFFFFFFLHFPVLFFLPWLKLFRAQMNQKSLIHLCSVTAQNSSEHCIATICSTMQKGEIPTVIDLSH